MVTDGWLEITGILFHDGVIRFGKKALETMRDTGNYWQLISRAEFKFLASCDLGPQWNHATTMPVLFTLPKGTRLDVRQPYGAWQVMVKYE